MIIGNRVKLRAIELKDLPKMVKWRNDPDIYQYFYEQEPLSLVMQKIWFENLLKKQDEKLFIIETTDEKNIIGTVGLTRIDWRNRKAELGRFVIGEKKFLGSGYGAEAEYLILDYAFNYMNLNKVYGDRFAFNERVLVLHKKFGFQDEGLLRKHIFKNGEYQDVIIVGLLREVFLQKQHELANQLGIKSNKK